MLSHAEFVSRDGCKAAGHGLIRTAYVEAVATAPRAQRQGSPLRCCNDSTTWWPPIQLGARRALSPSDAAFYERRGWELWRGPLAIRDGHRDGHLEPSPDDERVISAGCRECHRRSIPGRS